MRRASILRPASPGRGTPGAREPLSLTAVLLLERRQLRGVEREPLLRLLADRAVREQLLDRLVDERAELAALLERGAVLLVRDDLPDDRAVRLRLHELLRAEDRGVVE